MTYKQPDVCARAYCSDVAIGGEEEDVDTRFCLHHAVESKRAREAMKMLPTAHFRKKQPYKPRVPA